MIDKDLPDEIQSSIKEDDEARQERLKTLSMMVSRKRDEAVAGRAASGIEQVWREDEDSYEGFDDANSKDSRIIKGATSSAGLTRRIPVGSPRSTMFLNITRPYVDTAAARVGDMLLPTDDRSFEIRPEPIPEMTSFSDDDTPAVDPSTGQPLMKTEQSEDGQQMQVQATHADLAKQLMESAKKSAEAAQKRIDDWLVEGGYHAEKRKAILDCAKLGVGILKGPFPIKKSNKAVNRTDAGIEVEIQEEIKPSTKRIDPWNLYPDPSCGENIHNGNYILEEDHLTERQLKDLIGIPGYIEEQIVKCLKEGPQNGGIGDGSGGNSNRGRKNIYRVWYFFGDVDKESLDACGCSTEGREGESHHAVITVVNDRVIKAALNHLDSGEFPYDVMPWQVMSGSWTGIGIARQIRPAQGMIVAASRNMMDNAALSGGPILGINRSMIEPADGIWELTPRKVFWTTEDSEGTDIRTAMAAFDIPSRQNELMEIIQFALKMAEEVTGLPMLLQGQTGNAPDTLGGQIMANNNASTVLRRIARLDDDYITIPHISRYYEYLLMYGPEESEKGQFSVQARGSSVLVERDIQNHATIAMLQLSTNPAFGADPKKAFAEACRVQRLDPQRFQYSEEEMLKMQQMQAPEAPAVQVAKIRAQVDLNKQDMSNKTALQIAQSHDRLAEQRTKSDTDRDMVYVQAETQRTQAEHQARMAELSVKRELAMLDYANKRQMSLEQVKAELAQTALKVNAQKELSRDAMAVDVHKHNRKTPGVVSPPTEPEGRAPDGQAYQL